MSHLLLRTIWVWYLAMVHLPPSNTWKHRILWSLTRSFRQPPPAKVCSPSKNLANSFHMDLKATLGYWKWFQSFSQKKKTHTSFGWVKSGKTYLFFVTPQKDITQFYKYHSRVYDPLYLLWVVLQGLLLYQSHGATKKKTWRGRNSSYGSCGESMSIQP